MVDVPTFDGLERGDGERGLSDGPNCPECGEPFHTHDKEREYHDGGMWSYNYICD